MQWTRNYGIQLTADFHCREFQCGCGICSTQIINDQFAAMLQEVRDDFGAPITITSGYRCQRHQDDLRKQGYETAVGVSSHTMGIASDVKADDMAKLGESIHRIFGAFSIGTSSRFYHIDSRPNGPRRWSYKK